jgi:hypothetical protein
VHCRIGDLKQAAGYLEAAWDLYPNPALGYHLAQAYEKEHRSQEVAHLYRLAASLQAKGADDEEAVTQCKRRLEELKMPTGSNRKLLSSNFEASNEFSRTRTIALPKLIPDHASAEFFVLLGPGPKIEGTKFISGSEQLKAAGDALCMPVSSRLRFRRTVGTSAPSRYPGMLSRHRV